ncbi:MAG: hypothetical protein VX527_02620 [Planctomycetota bacterium]|nr:hypothetical protein [Planctomycetota bacterium]
MQTLTKMMVGVLATAALVAPAAIAADQAAAMKNLTSYIGTWESDGTTTDAWPNIPAGVKYTLRTEYKWNSTMDMALSDWKMTTADGTTLSMGTGMLTWSPHHKTLIYEYTGQDKGVPFHGSATMTGLTDTSVTWQCYERDSNGKQMWYLSTDTFPNMSGNSWTSTMQTCDSNWQPTGDANPTTMTRMNKFAESCGPMSDLIGTWTWDTKDASGQSMTMTQTYEWGPGNRSIMGKYYETQNGVTVMTACETIYSRSSGKGIRGHYWNNKGGNINWNMTEMEDNGSDSWWSTSFWGTSADGTPITGSSKGQLSNGNTMTFQIERFDYGGTNMPTEGMNPKGRIFKRTSTMANVPTG